MKPAIGSYPIALCVEAYPLGSLLLCTHPNVSDGRLGVACTMLCAHARRNNSRSRTDQGICFVPSRKLNQGAVISDSFDVVGSTGVRSLVPPSSVCRDAALAGQVA